MLEGAEAMTWQFIRSGWFNYLKKHWPVLLFISLLYLVGIIFGSLGVKALSPQQAGDLSTYFDLFLTKLKSIPLTGDGAGETVMDQLKIIVAIYLLGLSIIGIPLVLVLIFTKGFILGFTVGFLIQEKATKGILFVILSILPQNLLAIPALLLGGVGALSFALLLVKRRLGQRSIPLGPQFAGYTFLMILLAALTAGAGLTEAYITPVFMKLAAAYLY